MLQTHCSVQLSSPLSMLAAVASRPGPGWPAVAVTRVPRARAGHSGGCRGESSSVAAGNSDSEDVAMRSRAAAGAGDTSLVLQVTADNT